MMFSLIINDIKICCCFLENKIEILNTDLIKWFNIKQTINKSAFERNLLKTHFQFTVRITIPLFLQLVREVTIP